MDDSQNNPQPDEPQAAPEITTAPAAAEKKPEGIEHDPYEWGKCAITASIVWLPDGTVMLGARNHLDAPIMSVLSADTLITLPGHAAELPIPTVETIADLLAQLREDLPVRAKAKADRDETARRKAEEAKNKPASGKKTAKAAPGKAEAPAAASTPAFTTPAKVPLAGKAPAGNQISMFNFFTGGN